MEREKNKESRLYDLCSIILKVVTVEESVANLFSEHPHTASTIKYMQASLCFDDTLFMSILLTTGTADVWSDAAVWE